MLKSRAVKFISISIMSSAAVLGAASISFADSVTVRSGDTLSGIASSHETSWENLAKFNHLANPNLILPGQVLNLEENSSSSTPAPIVPPEKTVSNVSPASTVNWDAVASCEATGNWAANTGNGFYGGLQFTEATWQAYGGSQYAQWPYEATQAQQETVANAVLAGQGIGAWPVCGQLG